MPKWAVQCCLSRQIERRAVGPCQIQLAKIRTLHEGNIRFQQYDFERFIPEIAQFTEGDLWLLPGPMQEEPDDVPPGPRAEPREVTVLDDWRKAEAGNAASLARAAGHLGALDDRLRRSPEGWRHRLALIEAADLSWFVGDRIGPDRLALWISLRLSGVQDDTGALARVGWAARRLSGGPAPQMDLAAFLDRRDPENLGDDAEPFAERAGGWLDLMSQGADLHPITRACMCFHLWSLAGLGQYGDVVEAAVTAARITASEDTRAVFALLAMGGVEADCAVEVHPLTAWRGGSAGCSLQV